MKLPLSLSESSPAFLLRVSKVSQIHEFHQVDRTELAILEVIRLASDRQRILDDEVDLPGIHSLGHQGRKSSGIGP